MFFVANFSTGFTLDTHTANTSALSNSEIPGFFGLCSGSKLQAWENLGPKNQKRLDPHKRRAFKNSSKHELDE